MERSANQYRADESYEIKRKRQREANRKHARKNRKGMVKGDPVKCPTCGAKVYKIPCILCRDRASRRKLPAMEGAR